ncbi:Gfo/Idh/MocA family oxidoreductase [Stieleria sp. ICT_E10.1]|uniref:Gfo/Idh/MocA family protein n=1 Tax=Stieleria sedimenti TaxID=2976331 RepID=UPI00217F7CD6|nr:Gfo/Idh/MocA family oxidoreductase [Stieleria sedimenti]MCS7470508.1 Gfo/Idh/MocA family oxidoreductase [Stieleria sedimenti]
MQSLTRRKLIVRGSAVGLSALSYANVAQAASDRGLPRIGFIGCGGRSKSLLQGFAGEATVTWACDPDQQHAAAFQKLSGAKHVTDDLRRILDDRSIDAVVVATPDHWHAPASIMACDAGKHVYVEKPCSHNFREGRMLVHAARRNNVVVQHGTQSRTNPLVVRAINLLRDGVIGEVLVCKAWNIQRRRNIGHAKPSAPPAHIDYDTWVGPAEFLPFQSNRFHYDWHWWHNFGTGDIGNDGTHEIDIARWGLGVEGLPRKASGIGGKFYFDDDQQFPDTATCVFQWPGDRKPQSNKQLIFEMRIWSKNLPHNCDTGVEFYGTKGMLFVSKRGKLAIWDDTNQPIAIPTSNDDLTLPKNHQIDFLQAITESRRPAADITIGHDSCSLVHLANISVMVGRSLSIDPKEQTIHGDPEADAMLGRTYRGGGHWSVPHA